MQVELPKTTIQLGSDQLAWDLLLLKRIDGSTVKLTPKAAQVLALLLEHPARTVERAVLFDRIWPGSFSNDEVLTTVINELRRAFGDSAREPHCIATVPKLGYRWIGPAPEAPPPVPSGPPAQGIGSDDSLASWSARWREHPGRRRPAGDWAVPALIGATLVTLVLLVQLLRGGQASPVTTRAAPLAPDSVLALPAAAAQTPEPGLDQDPDFAADGQQYVYLHRPAARTTPQLRVRRIGEHQVTTLSLPGEGRPAAPAFAPDGLRIAYLWLTAHRCELRVLDLGSRTSRTLADGCPLAIDSSVDWAPDGRSLVFTRVDLNNPALASRNPALFRIAADGSGLRRISHSRRWLSNDVHPRFSPDGRRIAFVRDGDGRHQLWHLRSEDGGDERALNLGMWVYRVDWQDDRQLLVSGHGSNPFELWRVDLDGKGVQRLAGGELGPGLSYAPARQRLLIEQRRHDDNLWRLSLADALASPEQLTDSTRSERDPRLSPDGRSLAFLTDHSGNFELESLDLKTRQRRQLSNFAPQPALDHRWSPDGRYLAVVLGSSTGKQLAVLRSDGTRIDLPPTLAKRLVAQVEFSPEGGRLLLIVPRDGRRELRVVRFPELDREQLLLDFSAASLTLDRERGRLLLERADQPGVWQLSASGQLQALGITLDASPEDHWLLTGNWLAQSRLTQPGELAQLKLQTIDRTRPARELRLRLPEPPLGRPFDLGAGFFWFSQRDSDESDLVSFELAVARLQDQVPGADLELALIELLNAPASPACP